jgi:peptidoglycan hydrolase CwlO-like protein
MKKVVFSFIALLFGTSTSFATVDENTTLTTKNYVDSGLRAVYNVAKDAETTANTASATATAASEKVDDLEETIGDANDGLVKDVNDLKGTVGDANSGLVKKVNDLENTVGASYTGGVGVSVNANNEINLDVPSTNDGKTYVFKDGQWVELPVVNAWDPSILTTTPQNQQQP